MEALSVFIPPTPTAVPMARHRVGRWLGAAGVDDTTVADVLIVVSELVTNGVVHAPGGAIALSAEVDRSGSVTVEVTTTPLRTGNVIERPHDPDEHGRGLAIVAALANDLVIDDDHGPHTVRCRLAPH